MGLSADSSFGPFPGDDLIPSPAKIITHAITINAPPESVWPWLVQIGAGRAGWYSYGAIDNGGKPSAKEIIRALQQVQVGDILPAVPQSNDAFILQAIHPGKALVLVVPVQTAAEDPDPKSRMAGPLRVVWTLALEKLEHSRTKLISHARISADWLAPSPGAPQPAKRPILIERIYGLLGKMPWRFMLPLAMAGHY
ncbi:MAG TPA: hypothetical protein VFO54_11780, partial [Chryseosolibacter sp.]|nr:hypothetical protein [Chryseosolibacter sp.]